MASILLNLLDLNRVCKIWIDLLTRLITILVLIERAKQFSGFLL